MTTQDIASLRLHNQQIAAQKFRSAGEVVRYMGAMQAQDYAAALWAVGLRTPGATRASIEKAIADKKIVRTWPMRGTLHFVSPEDVRWMLKLLTPKVITGAASRHRNLELDEKVFEQSANIAAKVLQGGKILTRKQMCSVLEEHGIATANQRGIHILWVLSQRGLLCYGPHEGKEPTFTLLDEWLPPMPAISKDEALARLADRYFASHGPATIEDFATWTKLSLTDARAGLKAVENKFVHETIENKTYWFTQPGLMPDITASAYLLPGYDEYILGYRDRTAVLALEHSQNVTPGNNGVFQPTIVLDGQIAGLWKRSATSKAVNIKLLPFGKFTSKEVGRITEYAQKYGMFLDLPAVVTSAE